jgi:hypothetical protein
MEQYTIMYPRGQKGLLDDLVMAYMDTLRASYTAPGSTTTRWATLAPVQDFTRECFNCVAPSSSSSTDTEPKPRHHAIDAQCRARLDELAKARYQLDKELANLHRELREDRPRNPPPNPQQVPVQEQRRGDDTVQQERRPAAEQSRARTPTPLARGHVRDNNRRINEDTNIDDDDPPLFKWASQNLGVAAMLLRSCPEAATPEERSVWQQL